MPRNAWGCPECVVELRKLAREQSLEIQTLRDALNTAGGAPATAIVVLRKDLDTALGMLAHWCVAVDVNGTQWDDWDDSYKDAMYRDGPLRAMLDKAIAEARKQWG